jgi:RNA polymerase sigma-70 factor, ECF subfamily
MFGIAFMELVVEETGALDPDAGAFSGFYADALPRVYGYFLHRCGGSVPLAEDLTQETFLAAVAELKKGRRVDMPIRWIYGIARHKLVDHYRSRERLEHASALDAAADPGEIVFDEDAPEARDRAMAALAAVAASQRSVLVLCYLDGFSVQEIASALGKSTAAVHSLLERGRASFKSAYLEAAS